MKINFIDLQAQQEKILDSLAERTHKVLKNGNYILGEEVAELEEKLKDYSGSKHCITCGNGTDALQICLMHLNLNSNDVVFVPAFTFIATAEVVSLLKAKICFVDVDESTFNMCPISLERSINYIKDLGMSPKVVIPVDLFGLMADYRKIEKIALQHSLKIISDAAQSFGATMNEKRVGTFGNFTTTSFFPAKPLGCYGDGGAIFTDDNFSAEVFRSIRFHGKGGHKYDNVRIGINSRLDTLQAAVLLSKMEIFQDEVDIRNSIAQVYIEELKDSFKIQKVPSGFQSVWAQFTLCLESDYCREDFINLMNKDGIPTNIYYPKPLHLQKPYLDELKDPIGLLNSEMLSKRCLSLPMHPYLKSDQQKRIIDSCINNLKLL